MDAFFVGAAPASDRWKNPAAFPVFSVVHLDVRQYASDI
jgi:hypothetical protein